MSNRNRLIRVRPFEERASDWDDAVAAEPTADPVEDTTQFVIDRLEAQFARATKSIASLDTKAALVIPAIGIGASIVGANLPDDLLAEPWHLMGLGLVMLVATGAAAVSAVVSLIPVSRSNGPLPIRAVRGAREPLQDARWHYVRSLGFAVHTAEEAVVAKGYYLNWALRFGGVAVVSLILFIALGGLK